MHQNVTEHAQSTNCVQDSGKPQYTGIQVSCYKKVTRIRVCAHFGGRVVTKRGRQFDAHAFISIQNQWV